VNLSWSSLHAICYIYFWVYALFCSSKCFISGSFIVTLISLQLCRTISLYLSLQILFGKFMFVKIACRICTYRSTSTINLIIISKTHKKFWLFRAWLANLITSTNLIASLKVSLFESTIDFLPEWIVPYPWQEVCGLRVFKSKLNIISKIEIKLYIFFAIKIEIKRNENKTH